MYLFQNTDKILDKYDLARIQSIVCIFACTDRQDCWVACQLFQDKVIVYRGLTCTDCSCILQGNPYLLAGYVQQPIKLCS